jgi:hypothetical protein
MFQANNDNMLVGLPFAAEYLDDIAVLSLNPDWEYFRDIFDTFFIMCTLLLFK